MPTSRNIYVAVVDDDESLCRSLGRLLRAAGIQSITYASAEDFDADSKRPKFDCLVLDFQLGGMSGLDLLRKLRAGGDATPVIFNTAHETAEVREEMLAAGCEAFFRKTDAGADVLKAIRQLVP